MNIIRAKSHLYLSKGTWRVWTLYVNTDEGGSFSRIRKFENREVAWQYAKLVFEHPECLQPMDEEQQSALSEV